MKVRVCLDNERFQDKNAAKRAIKEINNRIVNCKVEIPLNVLVYEVGQIGGTFTPAVLYKERKVSGFQEMQVFCLDFDNGKLTLEDIFERCRKVHLPIVFVYETFSSSEECRKYRVGFIHLEPIYHVEVASFVVWWI